MADNYEADHLKTSAHANQTNHKPSPDQVGRSRLTHWVWIVCMGPGGNDPEVVTMSNLHPIGLDRCR